MEGVKLKRREQQAWHLAEKLEFLLRREGGDWRQVANWYETRLLDESVFVTLPLNSPEEWSANLLDCVSMIDEWVARFRTVEDRAKSYETAEAMLIDLLPFRSTLD